ncbi:hypothetical protein [Methanobrevibacter filiformis]|uniref:Uncharacterized protein n=1 Tax=Methanobrevibacter filiformis TaxID=55758 RepID=A0A166FDF4_9EURY|nr:hypothetical protein [Methanobrevibacter filiformis]KZX17562.1 hypothetical protein MBFIL_00850 [Methanobrevibacter filiformis]
MTLDKRKEIKNNPYENNNKNNNNISSKAKKQLDKHRLKIGFMNHDIIEEFCIQSKKVKIRYSSINEAKKAIARYKNEDWRDNEKPTEVYYCNSCNCWHTTSRKDK